MVSPELTAYIRKALDKKYPAIVIRGALKKSGYADGEISAAFAELRKEAEPPKLPKSIPAPPADMPKPERTRSDIPLPPTIQAPPKQHSRGRYIIAAALFLLALVLLMFAVFAPLLTNIG